MDSLLPCQPRKATVMLVHKMHFKEFGCQLKSNWPAITHTVSLYSGSAIPFSTAPTQSPWGHASAIPSPINEQLAFCNVMSCSYLPPRSAHCSQNTINNSGEDEQCPVADGDNTNSLRSELRQCWLWLRECAQVCVWMQAREKKAVDLCPCETFRSKMAAHDRCRSRGIKYEMWWLFCLFGSF